MMDEEESKTAGDGGGLGFVSGPGAANGTNGHAEDDLDDDSDDDYDCQVSILLL